MEFFDLKDLPKFKNAEEEIFFLRDHIAKREQELKSEGFDLTTEQVAKHALDQYKKIPVTEVLHEGFVISDAEKIEGISLRLKPETHDSNIEELFSILLEKGLKNVLQVIEKINDPHLDDDFHRFLVQYLISSKNLPGLKEGTPIEKTLKLRLYEITLPIKFENDTRTFRELVNSMDQFFYGLDYIGGNKNKNYEHYTIEIAQNSDGKFVSMYVSVPDERTELLEKHVLSIHPDAKILEIPDDYNIFSEGGYVMASYAELKENDALPLKIISNSDGLSTDPMAQILQVFSRLQESGEGASIQYVIQPTDYNYRKDFEDSLKKLKEGEKIEKTDRNSLFGDLDKGLAKEIASFFVNTGDEKNPEDKAKEKEEKLKNIDQQKIDLINQKISSPITNVNIRIFACAENKNRAEQIIHDIESSFRQFNQEGGNSLLFVRVPEKKMFDQSHSFSYRMFRDEQKIPISFKELSSMVHFPWGIKGVHSLKTASSGKGPAPIEMTNEGVLLGYNEYHGKKNPIYYKREDRIRHLYVIGQTGTGKTSILKNLIAQDIANGDGCCFIDPHGSDVQDILSYIPKERIDDVIYFDPAYTARALGLNMLEYDINKPEQKSMVIDGLMQIFNQLFDLKISGGAMFEQYFKNAAMLVMDHPESGNTLLEITRVLADKEFRDMKRSYCKNPIVQQFWNSAEKTTGDQGLSNFVPYISSKFDPLISNEFLRPIVTQEKSAFNMRDIMDNKKILLVNLSKGMLGELNANLIGMILVMKIQMAALSRADSHGQKLPDFYLYIDEFQNVTTPAIASILSEARKYRLSLNVAHQYIEQLPDNIRDAVFGNVGSMCVFRISPENAKYLEPKFAPTFTSTDIMSLENRNAYVNLIINGAPASKPFNIVTAQNPEGNKEIVSKLKEYSYLKYGRDRQEVEEETFAKYKKLA